MRALVIEPGPHYSVKDVYDGLTRGLQAQGVQTVPFPLGDWVELYSQVELVRDGEYRRVFEYEAACRMAATRIKAAMWDCGADVVVIVSSFFIPPDIFVNLRERKRHVVLWLTESPYEDARQVPMAPYADTVIVNDPINLDAFKRANPRSFYLPQSHDPAIHHANGRIARHDFVFVGTGYESRVELFEKVDWSGIDARFAGNWHLLKDDSPLTPLLVDAREHCIDNTDTADLYRASITSANLYRKEAMADDLTEGWAIGPREVELAACGTWFAREPRGEGDQLFPLLPTFTEAGELGDLIRWALTHEYERQHAIDEARAAVAERTFVNTAAELLRLIDA